MAAFLGPRAASRRMSRMVDGMKQSERYLPSCTAYYSAVGRGNDATQGTNHARRRGGQNLCTAGSFAVFDVTNCHLTADPESTGARSTPQAEQATDSPPKSYFTWTSCAERPAALEAAGNNTASHPMLSRVTCAGGLLPALLRGGDHVGRDVGDVGLREAAAERRHGVLAVGHLITSGRGSDAADLLLPGQ